MDEQTQHRVGTPGRLRFHMGDRGIDVAVPSEAPLADVVAAVLPQFGVAAEPDTEQSDDWVPQRLGEPPLEVDRTPTELNLLDGETIHLFPRDSQLLVLSSDGTSATADKHADEADTWSPTSSRLALRLLAATMLLTGLGIPLTGSPSVLYAPATAGLAVALLVAAAVLTRSGRLTATPVLLIGVAVAYAAASGWFAVASAQPDASVATQWMAATAAAAVALCAGFVGVTRAAPVLIGALTAVLLLALPAAIVAFRLAVTTNAIAIGLTATSIVTLFVPGMAFRLSGLTLPMLPSNAEELREDITPYPHALVVEHGAVTVRYLKGLHVGIGLAQCVEFVAFTTASGVFAQWFTVLLALLLLLRARHLGGVVQRWATLLPAGFAVLSLVVRVVDGQEVMDRVLMLWAPAFATGMALLLLSGRLPGRRLKPYWLRAVDILETLTAVAVSPVLLGVLDVYTTMRGLSS